MTCSFLPDETAGGPVCCGGAQNIKGYLSDIKIISNYKNNVKSYFRKAFSMAALNRFLETWGTGTLTYHLK
ncbi:MAG TPA: hypothetical protein DCZ61_08365 [Lachnospiraceae bacterium]|nr:hypothetical protein [Lachnospiraceae bacterium]